MGKKKDISTVNKGIIVALHEEGFSQSVIAEKIKSCQATVSNVIKQYKQVGKACIAPREYKERSRKTTPRTDKHLRKIIQKGRSKTVGEITEAWKNDSKINISRSTTIRRLKEMGYECKNSIKRPLLTKKQKAKRLNWAKEHKNWTIADWRNIIWSDESRFCVSFGDGGPKVWRRKGEQLHPDCTTATVKFPASCMVWGSMCAQGLGELVVIEGTVNSWKYQDILAGGLLPLLEPDAMYHGLLFQQDLAPAHSSRSTAEWFSEHCIEVLSWPGNSPDLNPIENIWGILKRAVKKHRPANVALLIDVVKSEWAKITPELCTRLIDSIPRRIEQVIKSKGGFTKY